VTSLSKISSVALFAVFVDCFGVTSGVLHTDIQQAELINNRVQQARGSLHIQDLNIPKIKGRPTT
jgi:hypothetical protein